MKRQKFEWYPIHSQRNGDAEAWALPKIQRVRRGFEFRGGWWVGSWSHTCVGRIKHCLLPWITTPHAKYAFKLHLHPQKLMNSIQYLIPTQEMPNGRSWFLELVAMFNVFPSAWYLHAWLSVNLLSSKLSHPYEGILLYFEGVPKLWGASCSYAVLNDVCHCITVWASGIVGPQFPHEWKKC